LIRKVIFTLLQFLLFFFAFGAGSFLPPFHIEQTLGVTSEGTRVFIWDGALLMTALFLVVLLIEALRKRIAASAPWTFAAFVLAAIGGYVARFGFLTR